MLDFRNLVLEALSGAHSLEAWYSDSTEFPKFRQKLKDTFKIDTNSFPKSTPFFTLIKDAFTRDTAVKIQGYASVYPIIDFLYYIAEHEGAKKGKTGTDIFDPKTTLDKATIDSYDTDYSSKFGASVTGGNPFFDFNPLSGKGASLHLTIARSLSKNAVGQLGLANFDELGIKQAIYGILAGHKKLRSATIGNKTIPSAVKYIDSVLNNPQQYGGGKTQIPNEFAEIYDNVSINELISISIAAHKFFESELTRFNLSNPVTTFYQFISNEPLDDKKLFNFLWTSKGLAKPAVRPAESAPGKGDPGQGGYTIANIKSINTTQSKELIQELEGMANFVRSGEPKTKRDIAGGLSSAAGGMRALVGKTMS